MIKNEMIRIQLLRKKKPINTSTDYIYNINHHNHCKQDNLVNQDKYRIMINLIPIYLLRKPVINIYDYVKK